MENIFTSSIGRKLMMSITGAFLVLFLLFHTSMNVVAIISAEGYNAICEFLGANWYAIAGTLVIAGGAVLHILFATILTLYNLRARGTVRYEVQHAPKGVSWASRNMYVLGLIVLGGLGLHLVNFWAKMQLVELTMSHEQIERLPISPTDGAAHLLAVFSNPVFAILYLVWFAAIWMHLTHGIWSMFQSIGWGNQTWYPRLKCAANILSTLIVLALVAVVVTFYLRGNGIL